MARAMENLPASRFLGPLVLLALLASCDAPKTIEGTIWTRDSRGNVSKMSGAEVHLVDPKIRLALQRHMKSFDEQLQIVATDRIKSSVAESVRGAEEEAKRLEKVLAELVEQTSANTAEADNVREAEARFREDNGKEAAVLTKRLEVLSSSADSVKIRIREQESQLATQQTQMDSVYSKQRATLEAALREVRQALEQEREAQSLAAQALLRSRSQVAERLVADYARDKIVVTVSFVQKYPSLNMSDSELCFSIKNVGTKAITALSAQVTVNGKEITDRFDTLFRIDLSYSNRLTLKQVLSNLETENDYKEVVYGVPPNKTWPVRYRSRMCFSTSADAGDLKRAWESLGNLNSRTSIQMKVVDAVLADPFSLSESRRSGSKEWRYRQVSAMDLFAAEVDAKIPPLSTQQKASNATAIERLSQQVEEASASLGRLVRERATNKALIDAQAELKVLNEEIAALDQRRKDGEAQSELLANKRHSIELALTESRSKLASAREFSAKISGVLTSLRSEKGEAFEIVRENVLRRLEKAEIERKWLGDLLGILEKAEGIAIRSDAEGRFRFERVTEAKPILYAAVRETKIGTQAGFFSYSDDSYLWLDAVDTSKTTLHDLGDFNSVVLKASNFDAIRKRVAVVAGAP